jgi:TM2 domain-containing membrane protein YozV
MEFYIAINGTQQGPFPIDQLLGRGLQPDTLVWRAGMPQWQRADSIPELATLFASNFNPPPASPAYVAPPIQPGIADKDKRIVAGVCAILIGSMGIHKFILGMTGPGLTMLLISVLTCGIGAIVMHTISIIEGVIYLTKTDEEFHRIYVVGKKSWF